MFPIHKIRQGQAISHFVIYANLSDCTYGNGIVARQRVKRYSDAHYKVCESFNNVINEHFDFF